MSKRFTPGPWEWWTSNSWRRLSSRAPGHQRDGGVLCPNVARDGHPDLIVQEADMALIAAAPALYDGLTELLDAIEPELIASASSHSGRDDADFREEFPADYERCKRLRAALASARGEQP